MRASKSLDPGTIEQIAGRFRLLGDGTRLRILNTLAAGERSVGELVLETGATQANVSKQLSALLAAGVLARRKEGLRVFYSIGDPSVFELCDIVCGSLRAHLSRELSSLRPAPKARPTARSRSHRPR